MIKFDERFARVDTMLRSGYHISSQNIDELNYMNEICDSLREFYSLYGVELVKTPESVYYLRTQDRSLMSRRTLDELEMTIGRVLCYMRFNLHNYKDILDSWIPFEEFIKEINSLIPQEKIARMYKGKQVLTDQEMMSFVKKVRSKLRLFKEFNFVQLRGGDNLFIRPGDSIFRFASDMRGADEKDELYQMLSAEGEVSTLTDVESYSEENDTEEEQLDFLEGNNNE